MGYDFVESAPMVRSSYLADKAVNAAKVKLNLSNNK